MSEPVRDIPDWLTSPEQYQPVASRDGFVTRNLLSVSSVLAFFRFGGKASPLSPSAPTKLLIMLVCILLTSLSRNFLFVLMMLAVVLVRACLLPREALARMMAGAAAAAGVTLLIMLPATLLGQPQSALTMATKAFVATGLVLTVALTTPEADLTRALRLLRVPAIAILTIDLTLRSIVRLGEAASEVLTSLRLRSVGRNPNRSTTMGGIGGMVLLKAGRAAQETHDAMRCRGFDGTYRAGSSTPPSMRDFVWLSATALLALAFLYLQGVSQ